MTTPTIDQIEAALPYVPAGLHCGDLTEPDGRREFAEVIHGIVVRAWKQSGVSLELLATALDVAAETPVADLHAYEAGMCAIDLQNAFEDLRRRLDVRQTAPESRLSDEQGSSAPTPQNDPPNTHTATRPVGADDLSVRWGTTEATIEWGPPKPGTHEKDLDYLGPCFVHGAVYLHCKTTGCAARGSAHEFDAAARWSRENAR